MAAWPTDTDTPGRLLDLAELRPAGKRDDLAAFVDAVATVESAALDEIAARDGAARDSQPDGLTQALAGLNHVAGAERRGVAGVEASLCRALETLGGALGAAG